MPKYASRSAIEKQQVRGRQVTVHRYLDCPLINGTEMIEVTWPATTKPCRWCHATDKIKENRMYSRALAERKNNR